MKELWVEKWRPKRVEDYVFKDDEQKAQVKSWIASGAISHLMFSGSPGTGKTTLAKLLLHELNVDWGDVLFINASVENGIDEIRHKITNFCSTMPFGEYKYVFMDEADGLSPASQGALRGVMETFSNTCRFLLTCNYPHKIISAIHSRCQGFHIERLDKTEFTARVAQILISEDVQFDLDVLDTFVSAAYPDLRKCIGLAQQNSQTGKLKSPSREESGTSDFKVEMISLFKAGKIKEARTLICKNASAEDYDSIFRFLYENTELWGDTYDKQARAIIIIRNGLVNDTLVADREINMSAVVVELELLTME